MDKITFIGHVPPTWLLYATEEKFVRVLQGNRDTSRGGLSWLQAVNTQQTSPFDKARQLSTVQRSSAATESSKNIRCCHDHL